LQKAAGTAMHNSAALDLAKESGNKVTRSAIGRSESNDTIACADARAAGSVESN
jgi:hypothetical protein